MLRECKRRENTLRRKKWEILGIKKGKVAKRRLFDSVSNIHSIKLKMQKDY